LSEEKEPYGYVERRVQIVATHPQFDARTFEYDLALLRFYEPGREQLLIILSKTNFVFPQSPSNPTLSQSASQTMTMTIWGRLDL
jgi:hypothetical protein